MESAHANIDFWFWAEADPEQSAHLVIPISRNLKGEKKSYVFHIARDLGIRANQIHRWRRDLETGGKEAFPGGGVACDQELFALKLELARVKKERDFSRDAAAFFAKESS